MAALEAQRALLGDAVVEASLAGLRARLAELAQHAPAAEPAQLLRQVSILFLDVVGSTALAQRLDPEEVLAVMDGALARGSAHRRRRTWRQGAAVRRRQHARRLRRRRRARGRCRARGALRPRAARAGPRARRRGAGRARPRRLRRARRHPHRRRCCSAAGSTPKAASAASPSTSRRAWSRPRRPARCASATTPTPRCAACSTSRRRSRCRQGRGRADRRAIWCCAPGRARFASRRAASRAWRRRMIGRDAELATLQGAFARLFAERLGSPS